MALHQSELRSVGTRSIWEYWEWWNDVIDELMIHEAELGGPLVNHCLT